MLEFFNKIYTWFIRLIHPLTPIGGLHISDQLLRFIVILGNSPVVATVRLIPGIFNDGAVRDRKAFLAALHQLRNAIAHARGTVEVIVTLETSRVYTQMLTLPALSQDAIPAALDLNLRANSPFPIESAYYDAEVIGSSRVGSPEFLGAYADRGFIDEFSAVLREAGFVISAIEFAALSLVRTCVELGNFDSHDASLIVAVMNDGVDVLIVRNKHLYFHDWYLWRDLHVDPVDRTVDARAFETAVTAAIRRVLNFYTRQWGGTFTRVLLIAPHLDVRLRELMKRLGLTAVAFTPVQFVDVAQSAPVALGAALRGLIPRSNDTMISLAAVGTERGFLRDTLLHFIAFWRYTIFTTFILLFAIFLITDSILSYIATHDRALMRNFSAQQNILDAQKLSERARIFNLQLTFIEQIQQQDVVLAPLLKKVHDLASSLITLRRVSFDAENKIGIIVGRAPSEFSAISFKNNLSRYAEFFDLDLPFAQIVPDVDGVTFQLKFNFRTIPS